MLPKSYMDGGYNLNEEDEKKLIISEYRSLLKSLNKSLSSNPKGRESIRQAFELSSELHKNMRRQSREPYILHPLAVAQIAVKEIGLGVRSTICALLHDTVEDTDFTIEDVKKNFGDEIATIVDGLTKINAVTNTRDTSQQAENFKKILLTLTTDARVILIKLADRLHNMRTLEFMKPEKRLKIASETIWVYAPLAHRLGLHAIKTELEDLSMKYLEPQVYKDIAQKLSETKKERTRYINEFIKPLKEKIDQIGVEYEIYGRPKSIYSIWNKIKKKGVTFEEVYDLFAIRVILKSSLPKEKEDCWKVYSVITDSYNPSPDRLRDWLSNPKNNGYEALHTTVMGPKGRWVEIQIRSQRMDDIAEKGVAAHFKYKEDKEDKKNTDRFEEWFNQIRENMAGNSENGIVFIEDFKTSFLSDEIYVYTPKGDLRMIPTGSTALDFAFFIHSDVGAKCIGAKVNHKLVSLSHKLKNGDQVEIITSSKQKPTEDWLNFVVTTKAKTKIKDSLREEKKNIAEDGKYILAKKLEHLGATLNQQNIDVLVEYLNLPSSLDLFYKIATESLDIATELKKMTVSGSYLVLPKNDNTPNHDDVTELSTAKYKKDSELVIFDNSIKDIEYKLAPCCNPIPGDEVFGFVSSNKGCLVIHRVNCPNSPQLLSNYGHRVVRARWGGSKEVSFLIGLKIDGSDDVGVVNKITSVISGDFKMNIAAISIDTRAGVFEGFFKVYVHNKEELETMINRIYKISSIERVTRVDADENNKLDFKN
ncbi:MAG: RelA/SpoT family protein [Phycisphaerales bacterium]|nr:RelA/SpoT family protein [Phycisphaerales bacterium]